MPELPEVETVRRGLDTHLSGRTIAAVSLRGARVARRHLPGPDDLAARLASNEVVGARRRGKYLWLELRDPVGDPQALVMHLGMSGQLLVGPGSAPQPAHLHASVDFADDGPQLRFVDQRTFGGLALSEVDETGLPVAVAHIARDPFDPLFDAAAVVARLKTRRGAIKTALLDQGLVSGIGNIYADEALWRTGIHGLRGAANLTKPTLRRLLDNAREVMAEALEQGGTSFDALYVNVNGASGYFDRRLAVYGQQGRPCPRCGTLIRREAFANRSSHYCPRCQPRPRRPA